MITGKAKIAGVIGWPVSHSRSPRLHNYWLNQYGIDGAYIPLAVPPEKLSQALRALPHLGFRGVNLTLPHKETAMGIVEHIDPVAKRIGAINTVTIRNDGTLEGTNTDAFGFAENLKSNGFSINAPLPLREGPGEGSPQSRTLTATILGAGGASRAVIVALQDMGFTRLNLINRTLSRAQQLARELAHPLCAIRFYNPDDTTKALQTSNLLVNTTSLGMAGQPPLEIDLSPLPKSAWVTDIVYSPLETDLLARAKAAGHQTIDGLGMLLHQARPGFAAWFGKEPEVTPTLRDYVLEQSQ